MTELVSLPAETLATDERFTQIAREVYHDDRNWSPASEQLIAARCQDAAHGHICLEAAIAVTGGRPVARAAAIIEPAAQDPAGHPEGWVGLVECLPDSIDAGVAVLRDRCAWLERRGLTSISAPRTDPLFGGVVTGGSSGPQVVLTPHNPPYYPVMLSKAGFTPDTRMVSFRFDRARAPTIRVPPGAGVAVRSIDTTDWDREVARLHALHERVFAGRPSRVPRQAPQTRALIERLRPMIDPDLVLVAANRAGDTIGMLICLPDTWQRRPAGTPPTRARLISIGILPGWRGRGAAVAMAAQLAKRLLDRNFVTLEASWIQHANTKPQRLARSMGGVPSRNITIYRRRSL